MATAPEKRKRPCDQCRASVRYDFKKTGNTSTLIWAACCGSWHYMMVGQRLSWKRPSASFGLPS